MLKRSLFLAGAALLYSIAGATERGGTRHVPADRALTFEERVAAQRAIERVYWQHRIWPAENAGSKPPLEQVLSEEVLRARVRRYLKLSNALAFIWARPVTGDQLQAEMRRMATSTRAPAVLRDLVQALHHDPRLIAETLVRPALVERVSRSAYAGDERFHGALRRRAEAALMPDSEGRRTSLRDAGDDYHEERWVSGEDAPLASPALSEIQIRVVLPEPEWNAALARLSETGLRVGGRRVLEEDDHGFRVVELLASEGSQLTVGVATWPKSSFDVWWEGQEKDSSPQLLEPDQRYVLVQPNDDCVPDTWQPTLTEVPDPRSDHSAVWTGTEMIVWGGGTGNLAMNTGGRYNPATDTWTPVSTGSFTPSARRDHSAVWTGTEMIVWGGTAGAGPIHTGAAYDPATDSWMPVPAAPGSPIARSGHTAVWTGTEMIVWGGEEAQGCSGRGARYHPAAGSWSAVSSAGPSGRCENTALWTGARMIVWGGWSPQGTPLNSGGIYDPDTDGWVETGTGADVPAPRARHSAIWTGTEMIVYGGMTLVPGEVPTTARSGARYDPVTNRWTSIPDEQERANHSAIWTGTEMIVWGGAFSPTGYGGRYDPEQNAWSLTSSRMDNVRGHSAVWTGSEMIVWGGDRNTGARYTPASDSWIATSTGESVPKARARHTMLWTGAEMVVWGGWSGALGSFSSGARYDPATDTWKPTAQTLPARYFHSAVWTGTEMIVWGGWSSFGFDSGGARYDPTADAWNTTSTGPGVPSGRASHHAFWTGKEMLVWGGAGFQETNTGGLYEPTTDSWRPTSTGSNVPRPGTHVAVWTGGEMIAWGMWPPCCGQPPQITGGRYDPRTNTWAPLAWDVNTPSPGLEMAAIWTGEEMIVWGGRTPFNELLDTGGVYHPEKDGWSLIPSDGSAPSARYGHTAVWTGTEMVVWGGKGPLGDLQTGARFDPSARRWTATSTGANVPAARYGHTAVWTGREMIVWGTEFSWTATGGRYCGLPILSAPDSGPVPLAGGRMLERKR